MAPFRSSCLGRACRYTCTYQSACHGPHACRRRLGPTLGPTLVDDRDGIGAGERQSWRAEDADRWCAASAQLLRHDRCLVRHDRHSAPFNGD